LIRRAIAFAFVAALSIAGRPHSASAAAASSQPVAPAATQCTVHRQYVPHTDKTGHILLKYDPDKSFFPIGLWGQVLPDAPGGPYPDWKELVAAGFNTIWPINWDDRAIPLAEAAGMQLVYMGAIDEKHAAKLKDHPNLLGNMWKDEPTGHLNIPKFDMDEEFAQFATYKKRINEQMPGLPVFINDPPAILPDPPKFKQWWTKWNSAGDVACQDNYPLVDRVARTRSLALEPTGIPQLVSLAVGINGGTKPEWLIVGAFDSPADPNWPFRMPTPVQLRCEVYTAIVSGATGIAYFIMDSHASRDGGIVGMSPRPKMKYLPGEPRAATPAQLIQGRALWEMATQVNSELHELTPVLLSPTLGEDAPYNVEVKAKESVTPKPLHCMLKRDAQDRLVLLAANVDDAVLSATFHVPVAINGIEVLFENRHGPDVAADRSTFAEHFEPFDVHVYRIHPAAGPTTR
jgi:hypothetical protein